MKIVFVEIKCVANPSDIDSKSCIVIFTDLTLKFVWDCFEFCHFVFNLCFRQILEDLDFLEFENLFKELFSHLTSLISMSPLDVIEFMVDKDVRNGFSDDIMLV